MDDRYPREESIEVLKTVMSLLANDNEISEKVRDALSWAIEALEAPEIVYCENCEYFKQDSRGEWYCEANDDGYSWKEYDFCSRGEEKKWAKF